MENNLKDKHKVRFRNYAPIDKTFSVLVDSKDLKSNAEYLATTCDDIIKKEITSLASRELSIVPKKPNYDLKRNIDPKLTKLKRKTQKVIVRLLRQKLNDESA